MNSGCKFALINPSHIIALAYVIMDGKGRLWMGKIDAREVEWVEYSEVSVRDNRCLCGVFR